MDRTLEGADPGIRAKYNNMVQSFLTTGSNALDSFVDSIRGDSTPREKMPKDGTVFQLTSNVILFLEQIYEFVDTLAMILTQARWAQITKKFYYKNFILSLKSHQKF